MPTKQPPLDFCPFLRLNCLPVSRSRRADLRGGVTPVTSEIPIPIVTHSDSLVPDDFSRILLSALNTSVFKGRYYLPCKTISLDGPVQYRCLVPRLVDNFLLNAWPDPLLSPKVTPLAFVSDSCYKAIVHACLEHPYSSRDPIDSPTAVPLADLLHRVIRLVRTPVVVNAPVAFAVAGTDKPIAPLPLAKRTLSSAPVFLAFAVRASEIVADSLFLYESALQFVNGVRVDFAGVPGMYCQEGAPQLRIPGMFVAGIPLNISPTVRFAVGGDVVFLRTIRPLPSDYKKVFSKITGKIIPAPVMYDWVPTPYRLEIFCPNLPRQSYLASGFGLLDPSEQVSVIERTGDAARLLQSGSSSDYLNSLYPEYGFSDTCKILAAAFDPTLYSSSPSDALKTVTTALQSNMAAYRPVASVTSKEFSKLMVAMTNGSGAKAHLRAYTKASEVANRVRAGELVLRPFDKRQVRLQRQAKFESRLEEDYSRTMYELQSSEVPSFFVQISDYFTGVTDELSPAFISGLFAAFGAGVGPSFARLGALLGPWYSVIKDVFDMFTENWGQFYRSLCGVFRLVKGNFTVTDVGCIGAVGGGVLTVYGEDSLPTAVAILSEMAPVGPMREVPGASFSLVGSSKLMPSVFVEETGLSAQAIQFTGANLLLLARVIGAVESLVRVMYGVAIGAARCLGIIPDPSVDMDSKLATCLTRVDNCIADNSMTYLERMSCLGESFALLQLASSERFIGPRYAALSRSIIVLEGLLRELRYTARMPSSQAEPVGIYIQGGAGVGKDVTAALLASALGKHIGNPSVWHIVANSRHDLGFTGQEIFYGQDAFQSTDGKTRADEMVRYIVMGSSAIVLAEPPFSFKGAPMMPKFIIITTNADIDSLAGGVTSKEAFVRRMTIVVRVTLNPNGVRDDPIITIVGLNGAGNSFTLGDMPANFVGKNVSTQALFTLITRAYKYKNDFFAASVVRGLSGPDLPDLVSPQGGLHLAAAGVATVATLIGSWYLARNVCIPALSKMDAMYKAASSALLVLSRLDILGTDLFDSLSSVRRNIQAVCTFMFTAAREMPHLIIEFVSAHRTVLFFTASAVYTAYRVYLALSPDVETQVRWSYNGIEPSSLRPRNVARSVRIRGPKQRINGLARKAKAASRRLLPQSLELSDTRLLALCDENIFSLVVDLVLGLAANQSCIHLGGGRFITTAHAFGPPDADYQAGAHLVIGGFKIELDACRVYVPESDSDYDDVAVFVVPSSFMSNFSSSVGVRDYFSLPGAQTLGAGFLWRPDGASVSVACAANGKVKYYERTHVHEFHAIETIKYNATTRPGYCGSPIVIGGRIVAMHALGSNRQGINPIGVALVFTETTHALIAHAYLEEAEIYETQAGLVSNPFGSHLSVADSPFSIRSFSSISTFVAHPGTVTARMYADESGFQLKIPSVLNAARANARYGVQFVPSGKIRDNSSFCQPGSLAAEVVSIYWRDTFGMLAINSGMPRFGSLTMADTLLGLNKKASTGLPLCVVGRTRRNSSPYYNVSEAIYCSSAGIYSLKPDIAEEVSKFELAAEGGPSTLVDHVLLMLKVKGELLLPDKMPRTLSVPPLAMSIVCRQHSADMMDEWLRSGVDHFVGRDPCSKSWHDLMVSLSVCSVIKCWDFSKYDYNQPAAMFDIFGEVLDDIVESRIPGNVVRALPFMKVVADTAVGCKIFDRVQGTVTGSAYTTILNTANETGTLISALVSCALDKGDNDTLPAIVTKVRSSIILVGYGDDSILGVLPGSYVASRVDLELVPAKVFELTGMVLTDAAKGVVTTGYSGSDSEHTGLKPVSLQFLSRGNVRVSYNELFKYLGVLADDYKDGIYLGALNKESIMATVSYGPAADVNDTKMSSRLLSALLAAGAHSVDFYVKVLEIARMSLYSRGVQRSLVNCNLVPVEWPSYDTVRRYVLHSAVSLVPFTPSVVEDDYTAISNVSAPVDWSWTVESSY